ncbi:MAG: hypothetical protein ACI9J3_002145 [Parvicellaceae bacterium]
MPKKTGKQNNWYTCTMKFYLIFVNILMLYSFNLFSEEIVVVQSVSNSRKTFIIDQGRTDGIAPGMESVFSTEDASYVAQAVESSRDHSMWRIMDREAAFSFDKGEIIVFNKSLESIYTQIPKLQEEINNRLTEEKRTKQDIDFDFVRLDYLKGIYIKKAFWIVRSSLSYAISESVSEAKDNESSRNGIQLELTYNKQWFDRLDWGVGIRIDKEKVIIDDPGLEIPTSRFFIVADLTYHFDFTDHVKNDFYASLGIGFGRSSTDVNGDVQSGSATLLPVFRLGYVNQFSRNMALLFEGTVEAVGQKETFESSGIEQSTNIINSKLTIGVRF